MDDMVIFGSSKEELHKLKRELDEFMAVNLKQVLKHNWQVFPTKVRGVDFVGYRFSESIPYSENRLAKHLSVGCLASPVKEKTM